MPIDVKKGQMLIRKIHYLMDGLELNSAEITDIEKDLMLGYIRNLYDMFLFDEPAKVAKPIIKEKKPHPVVVEPIAPPIEQPAKVAPPPPPPPPPVEPVKVVASHPIEETPVASPPQPLKVLPEHEKLFAFRKATDLSEKLRDTPVADLNKAFAINDKLLTISKLFNGDKKLFNETINELNGLNSFDEAKVYLSHEVVDTLNWASKERLKTAKIFVKTVRRRYL